MDVFTTDAKLWPSGDTIPAGIDTNSVTVPSSFNRQAADFATSLDGKQLYQFLFWNTGRHVTSKRNVIWNFSVGGWGLWRATRWYGVPPGIGPPGPANVRADAFTIGGDAPLSSNTPIDGKLSTFSPANAWPFMGDDHVIGTAGGAASVVAIDPFDNLQFAGWLQLMFGGDDSSTFVETDAGPAPGSSDFFDHVTGGAFPVAPGASAILLATYGNSTRRRIDWGRILQEIGSLRVPPILGGDPGPPDLIRLRLLEQLLSQTKPGESQEGADFEMLIRGAPDMSQEQLRRAVQSVRTTLGLGQSALEALNAQLKSR
jgi:hypothetical protein